MFQVDGFVIDGQPTICGLGRKFHSINKQNFKQGFSEIGGCQYRPHAFVELSSCDTQIETWAVNLLSALEMDSGTFHIEGMMTEIGTRVHRN